MYLMASKPLHVVFMYRDLLCFNPSGIRNSSTAFNGSFSLSIFNKVCEAFCGVHEAAPFMGSCKSGFHCDSARLKIRTSAQSLMTL